MTGFDSSMNPRPEYNRRNAMLPVYEDFFSPPTIITPLVVQRKFDSSGNDITCCVGELNLGYNTKTVASVAWQRNLRFQFSSGDIGYSSLTLNGEALGLQGVNSTLIKIHPNPATNCLLPWSP